MTISAPPRRARTLVLCSLAAIPLLMFPPGNVSCSERLLSFESSSQPSKKDYALIYGTVWGPDDRPVSGIPVRIRKTTDKKPKWELVSDSHGEFAQRVPAGAQDYIVEADIKMPKGQTKPEITVHIDDNERKDISLHLNQEAVSKTR